MRPDILITGYRGYIGSHLVTLLSQEALPPELEACRFMHCDLQNGEDFGVVRGYKFKAVVHLAADASVMHSLENPDACLDNNALKLIPFLTQNRVERIVFTSTGGALYGNKHGAREEEASWGSCLSPYSQSKYLAEKIIARLCPNHVILRLANVYGGNDSDRGEAAVHRHFREDNPIVLYGGSQTRDFIHVDTVCEAIIRALSSNVVGTFNLGTGHETSLKDLAEKYSQERHVSLSYQPPRAGEVEYISLDSTAARLAGLLNFKEY